MRVFISATDELSQVNLFDAAVIHGVTRVIDLQAGLHIPPVLAGITQRTSRLTEPAILRREIVDAAESAVLLVLVRAHDLSRLRQVIADLRPNTNIEQLSGEIHVAQSAV
jgi:hypothetical protein